MRVTKHYPTVNAEDIDAEADFWAAVLGGEVANADSDAFGQWRDVVVDGAVVLGVQRAPGLIAPTWPDDSVPLHIHLDVYAEVDEVDASSRELLALGARELDTSQSPAEREHGFRVYADPAGHPFCLCWG